MFFSFVTEIVETSDKWILVWEVEKALQALILADSGFVQHASGQEITDSVFNIVTSQEWSREALLVDNARSFMSGYLAKVLPGVRHFVEDFARQGQSIDSVSASLMPTEKLCLCIQNCKDFRDHIMRGKGAAVRMRELLDQEVNSETSRLHKRQMK